MRYLILLLMFPISVNAQIGVGHSVPLWGKTVETAEISYQYDRFSVHYFHDYKSSLYQKEFRSYKSIDTSTFAIAARVINSRNLSLGGIASINKFPTLESTNLNFLLELKIPLSNVVISYRHISNGFGLIHGHNQGYDSIVISLNR